MKPRGADETDQHYISRLESANAGLRQENAGIKKWAGALNEAVTALSCDASLAFQAMAEKARVRGHPSITAVVELFDTIAHPQWRGDKVIPRIKFPTDWEFDDPREWSGDADMGLNSPIADAIELLSHLRFKVSGSGLLEGIDDVIGGLERALQRGVDGVKDKHGFTPRRFSPATGHLKDMSAGQLRDLAGTIGWLCLDLAQDLNFANEMLRRDLRAATYRRVCADLYRLSGLDHEIREETNFDIKILGAEEAPF